MAIFHHSKYVINPESLNYIKAIKKYNKDCYIASIDGKLPDESFRCQDIDKIVKNDNIEIVIRSSNTTSLNGIWPSLPITRVCLKESYRKDFNAITSYIERILRQHKGPFVKEYYQSPPNLSNVDWDPELLMHAINNRFPVSGAIKLEKKKVIIFELNKQQFILDYEKSPLAISHLNSQLYFDIDDGFCGDNRFCPDLNNLYFDSFRESNYSQEMVCETNSGFPPNPKEMYLLNTLNHQINKFARKIKTMEKKAETQPNYSAAITVSKILLKTLQEERDRFLDNLDISSLKKVCLFAIDKARPILAEHRDVFSPLFFDKLITAILGICTLGISVAVTYKYAARFELGLFHHDTSSEQRLNKMVDALTQRPEQEKVKGYLEFKI